MYVKPEHIRDVFQQGVDKTGKEPSVEVQFGSVDQVEQFIDQAKADNKFSGDFSYENSKGNDMFGLILYNVLPIVFIIAMWVFIMRRMGGGGMGGASGIFNVGKSRSKM